MPFLVQIEKTKEKKFFYIFYHRILTRIIKEAMIFVLSTMIKKTIEFKANQKV